MVGKRRKLMISLAALLVCCMVLMTGCVRYDAQVSVKLSGKADVSVLLASSDDLSEAGDSAGIETDSKQEYEEDGWTVTDYKEEGYTGLILSKKNVDLTGLDDVLNDSVSENLDIKVKKDGFKYTLDVLLSDEDDGDESFDPRQILSYIEKADGYMMFSVNLPVKAGANNATTVSEDGKSLTWNLLQAETQNIHLEFTMLSISTILIIAGAVLAVLVILILLLKLKKKKK